VLLQPDLLAGLGEEEVVERDGRWIARTGRRERRGFWISKFWPLHDLKLLAVTKAFSASLS